MGNTSKSDKLTKSDKLDKLDKPINFNLFTVYDGINKLFQNNYTDCKIIGEIISFKISLII